VAEQQVGQMLDAIGLTAAQAVENSGYSLADEEDE
jgi:hypothetical protein